VNRIRLYDLRERAERVLATESPSVAEAHELAARVLEAIAALEGVEDRHPFRDAPQRDVAEESAAVVALERSLEASEERLRAALAEIATLRAGRT
jgi:hypothetical protein